MHATDFHGASAPFASLGRSLLSIRRDQIAPVDPSTGGALDQEMESFQRHVAELFNDLSSTPPEDSLLSLHFLRRLLDSFLICQEEFRAILFNNRASFSRPPLDRSIADFYDRSVKALDICNAVCDGIDQLRHLSTRLEIVLAALLPREGRALAEGHVLRAKKALADVAIIMLDDRDSNAGAITRRNRSFGRNTNANPKDHHHGRSRSLSWSVSKAWSAARQLQAISGSLVPPRANEITATNGLVSAVYTMSSVLLFVMWAVVAAIPCQDRGIQVHFSIPRSYAWASPILSLHERIVDESKKKERRSSSGLLREIHQIEKCARQLMDLTDVIQFPLAEERESEVREGVQQLVQVCDAMKEGLDPLERQIREVVRRIVRSRAEGMDSSGQLP